MLRSSPLHRDKFTSTLGGECSVGLNGTYLGDFLAGAFFSVAAVFAFAFTFAGVFAVARVVFLGLETFFSELTFLAAAFFVVVFFVLVLVDFFAVGLEDLYSARNAS